MPSTPCGLAARRHARALSGRLRIAAAIGLAWCAATQAAPDIAIMPSSAPGTIPDGGSYAFFGLPLGQAAAADFDVVNRGNDTLRLTGTPRVVLGGAHASDFSITQQPPQAVLDPELVLPEAGFEVPVLAAGGAVFDPSGTAWDFREQTGIARNGSSWFVNPAPEGQQAAFIQSNTFLAQIRRSIVLPAGPLFRVELAMVRGIPAPQPIIDVSMGATLLGTIGLPADDVWRTYSFRHSQPGGGGVTLSIDGLREGASAAIDDLHVYHHTYFTVRFAPTAGGARTATLQIASDDPDEGVYDIVLTGTGLAPDIAVEEPVGSDVPDGGARDYGPVALGANASRTLTIRNPGNRRLQGIAIATAGTHAANFTVTSTPASFVDPGGSTTFALRFTPSATGPHSATLRIASDDPDENPFDIALSGTGAVPEIALEEPAGSGVPDGGARDFGAVALGANASRTFTVRNAGDAELSGIGVAIDGTHAADFTVTTAPASNVAAGGSTTFTVRFAPSTAGVRDAALHLASNDGDENPFDIALSGTGATPEIVIEEPVGSDAADGGARDFGAVVIGANASRTFTVRNTGIAPLAGLGITLDGAHAADFSVTGTPTAPVAPGDSTTFTIRFAPSSGGARTAALHLSSNDADETPFDIALTGRGTAPEIALEQPAGTGVPDGGSRHFGGVALGQSADLIFDLTNVGDAPLALTGTPVVAIDGAQAADFTVIDPPLATIAPAVAVANASFETPAQMVGGFTYAPTGSGWTFGSEAGIARNGSTWYVAPAPSGAQAAFLQRATNASVARAVTFEAAGAYRVAFSLVRRSAARPANTVEVRIDGVTVGTIDHSAQPDDVWRTFSVPYTSPGPGTRTLSFVGVRTGADYGSALDDVRVLGRAMFRVRFTPGASGARSATLAIASDDADENPYDIALGGDGLVPDIAVEQPVGTVVPDGGSRNLGFVLLGNVGSATFTIRNTGTAALNGLAVMLEGGADFTATAPAASVPAGGTTTFQVRFTPTVRGAQSTIVHVASNDPDEDPYDITVSATGVSSEISVEEPVGSDVSDGGARDYGTVSVGADATRTFTVGNSGNAPLMGVAVTLVGAHASDFTVTRAPGASVAPGASTTFDLRFAPSAAGARTATLRLFSNDADESPYDIALSGTARAADIALEQPAGTTIVDGGHRSFGAVRPGEGAELTFAVSNAGEIDLTGLGLTIDGADASEFSVTAMPVAPVAPWTSTSFTLRFLPTAPGAKRATLHLASNDPDEHPYDVELSGVAAIPEIALEQPRGSALADGGTRDFGAVAVGQNAELEFDVVNAGTAALALTGDPRVAIAGAHASDFSVVATPAAALPTAVPVDAGFEAPTLAPGAFVVGPVGSGWTFAGSAGVARSGSPWFVAAAPEGTQAAYLQNAASSASQTVTFAGAGMYRIVFSLVRRSAAKPANTVEVRVDGATLATIEHTAQPDDTWRTFSVPYESPGAGTRPLTFAGVRTGGDYASALDAVRIEASSSFRVRFAPSAPGPRSAALSIASDDANENPYDITLSGFASAPDIAVEEPAGSELADGAARDFGATALGTDTSRTFTVRNTGDMDLTGLALTLDGAHAADYAAVTPPATMLASGASTTFVLRFAPSAAGVRTATLQVASNDPDENPFDVALSGTGTVPEIAVEQPAGDGVADGGARDFGTHLVGAEASRTFTIRNVGNAPLSGVGVAIAGPHGSEFTLTSAPATPVAAGGSATFVVRFAPAATGARNAALTIASSDADEAPYDVALSGTGAPNGADLAITKTNGESQLATTRDTIYAIRVTNAGPAAVSGLRVVDDLPAAFTDVAWTCAATPPVLCPAAAGLGDIDHTIATPIPSGGSIAYDVVARPTGVPGQMLTNNATVQSLDAQVSELDAANNGASDTDPLVGGSIFANGFEN